MSRSTTGRVLRAALAGAIVAAAFAGLGPTAATAAPAGSSAPGVQLVALPHGPATCKPGFVWRTAAPHDLVCVPPGTRQATHDENALAASRREPGGGAWGPNTCRSGFVWRLAFPEDLVCVTPDRRAQAAADNAKAAERRAVDPATLPQAQRPGTHTVVLNASSVLPRFSARNFGDCFRVIDPNPSPGLHVGWGQVEAYGDPCVADVNEVAVRFDEGPLDRVPVKTIDRAVLTYGESPAQFCIWPPGTGGTCWRSGSGAPEPKPNGCVAALGIPTVDWVRAAPPGLVPHITAPHALRNNPREWDVSTPYRWQYTRSAPLGASAPPPFGFLLSGGVALDRLTAQDNTNCVSTVSNIQLHVTYTVPADHGGEFVPPR